MELAEQTSDWAGALSLGIELEVALEVGDGRPRAVEAVVHQDTVAELEGADAGPPPDLPQLRGLDAKRMNFFRRQA